MRRLVHTLLRLGSGQIDFSVKHALIVGMASLVAISFFLVSNEAFAQPLGFYSLRDLEATSATDVSDDGIVTAAGIGSNSIRWTAATGALAPPIAGSATAISADGLTVVGAHSTVGFRWNASQGYMDLPRFAGGGGTALAHDVSANGAVVVGEDDPSPGAKRAFKWTAATGTVQLGSLGGVNGESSAYAISRDGMTTVGTTWTSTPGVTAAFIHTDGTGMQSIGNMPGSTLTEAHGISGDKTTIVGFGRTGTVVNAFRWRAGTGFQDLGDLGPVPGAALSGNQAWGVNGDGSIIVGSQAGRVAMIWDQLHGMRRLQTVLVNEFGFNLTGWTLEEAQSISNDGRFVTGSGTFQGPTGLEIRGWVAVIPEPDSGMLAMFGVVISAVLWHWLGRRSGPRPSL